MQEAANLIWLARSNPGIIVPIDKLRVHADKYFEWLSDKEVFTPPELEDYFPVPAFTEEFIAHVAVPIKLFYSDEFQAIEQLLRLETADQQQLDFSTYLTNVLAARFQNLTNRGLQENVNIVSIGGNCVPRLILSKWGLRTTRSLGARSLPFDLVWVEPKGVCEILTTHFSDMVARDLLSITTNAEVRQDWKWFVGTEPTAVNNLRQVCFNHEPGKFWLEDNYFELIRRYDLRISRFKSILSNGKPTIALLNYHQPFSKGSLGDLINAARGLSELTMSPLYLICVVTAGPSNDVADIESLHVNRKCRLTVRYNRQPSDSYIFYSPLHYATADGLAWEQSFIHVVAKILKYDLGISVSAGSDNGSPA